MTHHVFFDKMQHVKSETHGTFEILFYTAPQGMCVITDTNGLRLAFLIKVVPLVAVGETIIISRDH